MDDAHGGARQQDDQAEGGDPEPGLRPAAVIAALDGESGGEYAISWRPGKGWYAWRYNCRSGPLRAADAGELRAAIREDRHRPRPPLPYQAAS